ncbi:probable disease resistance protein At1g61310 [Trifolium pratense]|uniref:probable disease resistance protein At1g61310 n=1 Tax=Trifolium pratense TaxID=57577 RepID=UPI001E694AFF|nr:probable disease resistance protein At1g61310 [Trifolium pratense]XP_045786972.1 probable disease resistance protein At1g61310 [Trifolium pratense]
MFENIMKDVESEKKKLILNRDIVQEKLGATPKTEKVNNAVFEWLKESEKLVEEEEILKEITELEILNYDCSFAWIQWLLCADHKMRNRRYREILDRLKALNSKCEFEPFSTTIPPLEYFSSGYFVPFKSIKEASDRLLAALQDSNCSTIGLYGKRGSGKTKLVKTVGEKAKYLNIFDEVAFATVSENPNVRRIQDEIADSLNLKFTRNTQAGRARTISSELKSKDRVLVILDDVQARIELEDIIGIPGDDTKGFKVLLTTRRQRECALMDCKEEFSLGPLSDDEAWTLLKKHSGIGDGTSSDILNVARQVALECEGLPGTIKEVGSSLKSKHIKEWKASLDNLRHSMARWQIFISFRGEDTRFSFTGFLYEALLREGFKIFMDDGGGLDTGDQISPSLINAIEASRLSIVVLSENYASSSWCLDELAKILECKEKKNQIVWPIFYKVDPSHIRHLRNGYGNAMTEHENVFGNEPERLQKWRLALFEVAGMSGKPYETNTGYEYKFIQKIVEHAKNIRSRLYIRSMDMD